MNGEERDSGIDLLGHVPWGTHFCQFYETREDLTSILIPYFKAGLENNEFCIWVTAKPLGKERALAAMRRAMPDFDLYLVRGQIEIIPRDQWYLRDDIFNLQMVLERWIDKLDHALKQGYDGLRVTGNTSWLEKNDWKRFTKYEEEINKVIGKYRMIAIYTYSLNRCSAAEVIDVVNNHQFALIRRQGQWQMMESTEHKRAKEALRKAEENFRRSMDESPLGIRIVTPEGKTVYANPAILDIYGYSSIEELEATPRRERCTPESYAEHQARKEKRQRGEYVPSKYEISIVRKDGEIRHLEVLRKEVPWNGKPRFQVLYQDVTERKRAEEALRSSEEKLRIMFKSVAEGIVVTDLEGNILEANEAAARQGGYNNKEELIELSSCQRLSPKDLARAKEDTRRNLTEGYTGTREYTFLRKDGTEFLGEVNASFIRDASGNPVAVVSITRDITERKQVEEERVRADKLESVGTLAGGIAHDFNNLLTGILGNIELAKRYSEAGEMSRASATLSEAERASLRAKDLTQQLLTFAKGGAPIKKLASITELAKETATFALSGSKVKCQFDLPDDLWAVECDERQIGQVISNIVINADQAMPRGGILKLSARNTVIGPGGTLPLPKGNYVEIIIEDHGIGIPREHLDRIFDPYFTTKHKGSGLGLATSYSIIRNHGGHIRVESELGVGTTCYVYLPASKKPVRKIRKKQALRSSLMTQGKILVMDDEEIIREMLSNLLSVIGYKVTLAKDGVEAIERYTEAKNLGQPFDAVILDLTIRGGMGGREAIKKLIEIDPDVKAIVSSGYATDPIMADYKKHGFSAVVTKPYSAGELERTLRSILKPKK